MRIAVDCEFSFDIDNEFVLICAAVTQEDGVARTWWRDQLDDLRAYIWEHHKDTWVAHNVETAEGYMFQSLGFPPTRFKFHDTLMMSRVAYNACSAVPMRHSLADCLKRERLAELDTATKHEDQSMCIWYPSKISWEDHLARLDSNREHLMQYCLSDTAHLLALDSKLDERMRTVHEILDKAEPLSPERFANYYGFLAAYLSEVSWNGIPLNADRVNAIKRNAPHAMTRLQKDFERKYPGSFRVVSGRLCKNVSVCRAYAEKVYGEGAPKTASGAVSLASEHTKSHKDLGDFLGDYFTLDKRCRALASFAKHDREKNWLGGFLTKRGVVRPRINLLGTHTGRCGSKPSTGFVYTMGKPFRGLVDPPEGFVLVELDYHSEEIGVQAYLTGDKVMSEMYEGPDYYTSIAQRLDPTVKDKHDPKRKKYKIVSLMSNYGCGAAKLARIAGIEKSEAQATLRELKKLFSKYWKFVDKRLEKCTETSSMYFSDGFRIRNSGGKTTTLANWPFQGAGAVILRKLLVRMYQERVRLVAPVHDAVVFMAPEASWRDVSERVAQAMRDVSREVVGTEIDVGDPEVTYHGIVNCHSELSTREQYASTEDNEYKKQFLEYLNEAAEAEAPDTEHLYVDEVLPS